jgi:LPXTG-site transpeptidase (sortase) family protein
LKKLFKINQILPIASGILFLTAVIFSANSLGLFNEKVEAASKPVPVISKVLPVVRIARIKIPKIKVDAPIINAGLTVSGELAVPKGPAEAAWFSLGPRPGEIGNAVISGHYGWKDNIPAVFDNLSKLKKGDKVYFQNENGTTTAFVVRSVKVYGQNAKAPEVFISTDGKAHLNLITCGGIWNKTQKSYSNRLVVFTDKVS